MTTLFVLAVLSGAAIGAILTRAYYRAELDEVDAGLKDMRKLLGNQAE